MTTANIVGSGPNGLAAASLLAREGVDVTVFEANDTIGGGARSDELTLPGFVHDTCAAIHPLGVGSPFFAEFGDDLARHGLTFVHPEVPAVHPLDGGRGGALHRTLDATAATLGADGDVWRSLVGPFVERWDDLAPGVLGPLIRVPEHPFTMARFGLVGIRSAMSVAKHLRTDEARGLFAGMAAHAILPLTAPFTASFGVLFAASGNALGWPGARGGSQAISDAMAGYVRARGGEIVTGRRIEDLADLPPADATLLDVTPRQLVAIAGDQLSASYRRRLEKFRYGPGSFKLDYALDGPIPWTNADARRAGTVHLGGTIEEIAAAEAEVAAGRMPARPFVLVAQQSIFDDTRAPSGKHTLWAYCHVPSGFTGDASTAIEDQIERFAPGFRDLILARHKTGPAQLQQHNANYIGGDISAGSHSGLQAFARPVLSPDPYRTSIAGVYLCSASTPPGAGVHGMAGFHAARSALRRL